MAWLDQRGALPVLEGLAAITDKQRLARLAREVLDDRKHERAVESDRMTQTAASDRCLPWTIRRSNNRLR